MLSSDTCIAVSAVDNKFHRTSVSYLNIMAIKEEMLGLRAAQESKGESGWLAVAAGGRPTGNLFFDCSGWSIFYSLWSTTMAGETAGTN